MDLTSYLLGKNSGGGGGGTTPQSLDDITTILKNYLTNVPNSYEPLSTDNVTLYTPDAEYKNYFIQKRSGNYYRIVWIKEDMINCSSALYLGGVVITNATSLNNMEIAGSGGGSFNSYFGRDLLSIDACIDYAKDINSTYTKTYNSLGYIADTPNVLPVSNIPYFYSSNGTTMIGTSKRISSNETIEVKS